MGANTFNAKLMRSIRSLARSEHVSFLVGAGASIPSDLPNWSEFAVNLLAESFPDVERETLARMVETQGVRLACEAALGAADLPKRRGHIARALFRDKPRVDYLPSMLHYALADVAVSRGAARTGLATFNYDDLIETAIEPWAGSERVVARRGATYSRSHADCFVIHHLHGLLGSRGRKNSDFFVVTESDYFESRDRNANWQLPLIAEFGSKGPIVMVGMSLSDPNLLEYLLTLRSMQPSGRRYALIPWQSYSVFGFNERKSAEKALRQQWKAVGVTPLFVEDFADVATLVFEIQTQAQGDADSPAQRATALWDMVTSPANFGSLQKDWAASLQAAYETRFSAILGAEGNLVLWLADGRGSVYRFAANDRWHPEPRHLRSIPHRHDTGWVATDVMCEADPFVVLRRVVPDRLPTPRLRREWTSSGNRWKTVGGVSISTKSHGGARTVVGALTAATSRKLDDDVTIAERWQAPLNETASEIAVQLSGYLPD